MFRLLSIAVIIHLHSPLRSVSTLLELLEIPRLGVGPHIVIFTCGSMDFHLWEYGFNGRSSGLWRWGEQFQIF
jgi:hypothetical protein